MALMISLAPVNSESYLKCPLDVASATDADLTPRCFKTLDSMWWTHEAQVIPSICQHQTIDSTNEYGLRNCAKQHYQNIFQLTKSNSITKTNYIA